MSRLVAFASESTRVTMLSAYQEIDFEFLAGGDRLERCLRKVPIDGVFLVAPDLLARDVVGLSGVFEFPTVPLIICGKWAPELAAFVAMIARYTNPRVYIEQFDEIRSVTQFVNEQSPAREQLLFHSEIEVAMERLSGRVRLQIEAAMRELPVDGVVGIVAARLGHSERWLLDAMHAAGFKNTHSIFDGQRTINAWGFAKDPGFAAVDVARKCGYEGTAGLLYAIARLGIKRLSQLAKIPSLELVAGLADAALRSRLRPALISNALAQA